ncbi:hypothetical protein [Candidatus Protochlamydia sp. R18]|uniref:hypothetical protein n=1 Tax=Candidatus Protochlamydia sp. R18 TaxID=1353977 RepID=UPI0005A6E386|nr:hypothetical protein [Candidatus Protochlamydia sp. R18]
MEESNFKAHMPSEKNFSAESLAAVNSCRLGAFFDLLLQIDKRNHPELYEHNQRGASPDQATKWPDSICKRGD